MSVYTAFYTDTYGGFPSGPLDVEVSLSLGGTWTDISSDVLQREGTSPAISVARGRSDETASANPATCAMQWANRSGQFSPRNPTGPYYGLLNRNTPVRVSVPDSGTYLRFADDNQSWVSCPDSSALQLTGDFDARIDMWLDDYQPCTLAGKWGGPADLQAWCLVLNGDGTVTLYWCNDGDVSSAQSTQPLPYVGRIMVRAYFTAGEADLATVWFYTAPSMAGSQAQLGEPVTVAPTGFAQAAATQPVQVGYVGGFAGQGVVSRGLLGKVYEFQLYNATPDLVADPQFFSQSAGASSFTDGQGNTWTTEGTSEISGRSYRGHFECSSLPQQWDPTGTDVWTPVGASGILRRLQQGNSPLRSVMYRGCQELAAPASFQGYWPFEDPTGSTAVASGLAGGQPMTIAGVPAFQGQSGSPSADSTFACSAQLVQVQQATMAFRLPGGVSSPDWGCGFLLGIPSGGISADCTLLTLSYSSGDRIEVQYFTASGGTLNIGGTVSVSGPTGVNGTALWVAPGSGTGSTGMTVLAAGAATETTYSTGTGLSGNMTGGTVNEGAANLGDTEIGHLWVSSSPPDLQANAALLNAWNGETAAYRFARLCAENSIASRIYGFPELTVAMGDQTIDTLANLLSYCETSDRGMLYEPAEALGLGYRTLHSLCSQSPLAVLDYSQAQLGGDGSAGLTPTDDDQYTINDATVSRNNGSSVQVQVTTGPMSVLPPSEGGVGDYDSQVTVYTAADSGLADIAGWITWIGTADEERYPVIPLNLARDELAALVFDIQDVRLGDYIQVVNPPAWLPPGPISQLVYGTTEKLGGFWYLMAWNAVPETPYEVAVAGTGAADSAHADTAGSELAAAASSTATTLSVETTAGPVWTTNSSGGSGQQAIVPLYSYPPSGFWSDVTANYPQMGMIICNVDSGPGTSYESNFAAVFAAAAAAGITCLGYVPTGYGSDTLASVEAQVDLWQTYYGITSIMFDTVSTSSAYLSHYTSLVDYVHARGGIAVLNPGAIPAEGYMSIGADVIQVCEDSYSNLAADAAAAPSWLFDYPATSISVTCNTCPTSGDMVTAIGLAGSAFNAHYVWVTADGIYAAEPSYFAAEVSELAGTSGGGDFPFDVAIAGERITVTGITGSSSPQAFGVIRSVNGVVKAQAAGAAVSLFRTPVAALA
jgi:hypothetical protein